MIYATKLLFWADAFTVNTSLILVKPAYVNDTALIKHEEKHQEQMKKIGVFRFWWLYATSKEDRKRLEVEAYTAQMANGARLSTCAVHLTLDHNLGISYQEAVDLLIEQVIPTI
jgi:hypothetical protein